MEATSLGKRKHKVELTDEEKETLQGVLDHREMSDRKKTRATILLLLDERDGAAMTSRKIAGHVHVNERTVSVVARRFVEEGLEAAVQGKHHDAGRPRGSKNRPGGGPYGPRRVIDETAAETLSELHATGYYTFKILAERAGVSERSVRRAVRRHEGQQK